MTEKQKVRLNAKAAKNESGNTHPLSSSGLTQGSRGNKAICVTGFPCRSTGMTQGDESGKSMVEMLGVLALMGLLAILGAKGYNMAMERAMANNIINEVNRRSVVYSQQMIANGDLSSTEFENEKNLGSSVVTGEKLGSQLFRVKVTEVSSASCRHIINSGYDLPFK